MARSKRFAPREEEPELDMSSMIDVSFLLLIYFIITSTLDPKEADLGMKLPTTTSSSSSTPTDIDPMDITVNSEGHVIANEEILDTDATKREVPQLLEKLRDYVSAAKLTDSETVVIISADNAASGQRFLDVLNALSDPEVAIKNVSIRGFSE